MCSWDEDAKEVLTVPMKRKGRDIRCWKRLSLIPIMRKLRQWLLHFLLSWEWLELLSVNIHTVKSLQAVVLNYEGRISEQMRVIGRLEMKHGD